MLDLHASAHAFAAIAGVAVAGWLVSVAKHDVSIVDGLWSIFFLVGALTYAKLVGASHARAMLVLGMVGVWGVRLAGYIIWRNRGEPEDRRYKTIRARNQPGFALKSLYLVFGLQAVMAWVIAVPLFVAITAPAADDPAGDLTWLDFTGAALWTFGLLFEVIGDWQLARFKRNPASHGQVLDTGLWRYTRHPNYFGEATLWWGFFLVAVAGGGWWTFISPVLMTLLLLKVSGVTLLERDIQERRPAYRRYIARTSAFFPRPPRSA